MCQSWLHMALRIDWRSKVVNSHSKDYRDGFADSRLLIVDYKAMQWMKNQFQSHSMTELERQWLSSQDSVAQSHCLTRITQANDIEACWITTSWLLTNVSAAFSGQDCLGELLVGVPNHWRWSQGHWLMSWQSKTIQMTFTPRSVNFDVYTSNGCDLGVWIELSLHISVEFRGKTMDKPNQTHQKQTNTPPHPHPPQSLHS